MEDLFGASQMTLVVKNLPANAGDARDAGLTPESPMQEMQEMLVWPLSQEDPLEEGMATHPSTLAWRIPWTEEPGRLCPQGDSELDMTEAT